MLAAFGMVFLNTATYLFQLAALAVFGLTGDVDFRSEVIMPWGMPSPECFQFCNLALWRGILFCYMFTSFIESAK